MWWFLSETNGGGRRQGISNKGQAPDGQTAEGGLSGGGAICGCAARRPADKRQPYKAGENELTYFGPLRAVSAGRFSPDQTFCQVVLAAGALQNGSLAGRPSGRKAALQR